MHGFCSRLRALVLQCDGQCCGQCHRHSVLLHHLQRRQTRIWVAWTVWYQTFQRSRIPGLPLPRWRANQRLRVGPPPAILSKFASPWRRNIRPVHGTHPNWTKKMFLVPTKQLGSNVLKSHEGNVDPNRRSPGHHN